MWSFAHFVSCTTMAGRSIFTNWKNRSAGELARFCLCIRTIRPGTSSEATKPEQLKEICRDREVALIVDEVFLDYELDAPQRSRETHRSFAFDDNALTFVLSGLSKIAALPQMKVGWIAANGPDVLVRDAMARLEVISDTYLSLSAPLQLALPALLGQREKMQPQLLARIEANLGRFGRAASATEIGFAPRNSRVDGTRCCACPRCSRTKTLPYACFGITQFSYSPGISTNSRTRDT